MLTDSNTESPRTHTSWPNIFMMRLFLKANKLAHQFRPIDWLWRQACEFSRQCMADLQRPNPQSNSETWNSLLYWTYAPYRVYNGTKSRKGDLTHWFYKTITPTCGPNNQPSRSYFQIYLSPKRKKKQTKNKNSTKKNTGIKYRRTFLQINFYVYSSSWFLAFSIHSRKRSNNPEAISVKFLLKVVDVPKICCINITFPSLGVIHVHVNCINYIHKV